MTIAESFIVIQDNRARMSDGHFTHRFDVCSHGASPGPGLASVTVANKAGAWELTYETATGLVTDVDDAAIEMEVQIG